MILSAFALYLICGIAWTGAYILIIRRAYLDRFVGMPLIALSANISWEFIFTLVIPAPAPLWYFAAAWLFLDVIMLGMMLLYAKRPIVTGLMLALSVIGSVLILLWGAMHAIEPIRSAFGQNFIMSVLFVTMLLRVGSSKGQSMYIALLKAIGTGAAILIAWNGYPEVPIMRFIFLGILCFDILYAILLYRIIQKTGTSPFRRV